MSRLIVKNLPVYLDDARLQAHFSARGHVTDVKLIRRPDGTSRRFGFVGYSSEHDARSAMEYFNKTFIDTSRIVVDLAKKIDDPELDADKKRKRKQGAEAGQHSAAAASPLIAGTLPPPKKKTKVSASSAQPDAKPTKSSGREVTFDEFFAALAPKAKRNAKNAQTDDVQIPVADLKASDKKKKKKSNRKESPSEDSDEELQTITNATDQPPNAETEQDEDMPDAESQHDDALDDEGLTDMDYLARRMTHKVGGGTEEDNLGDENDESPSGTLKDARFEQSDADSDEDEDDDGSSSATTDPDLERTRKALAERARKDEENVDALMASSRIFARNLPFSTSSEELEATFGKFGVVSQVHIPLDKETKAPKGMAFVTFAESTHAVAAFRALDGSTFQGRLLHLIPAVDKQGGGGGGASTSADGAQAPSASKQKAETLKQSKLKERRALAGKEFNWSTLYMNPDAVATSVADRLGISKSDILNPDAVDGDPSKAGASAAVRLALAETRVIQETKDFLVSHGINLDAFEENKQQQSDSSSSATKKSPAAERSQTTMLVKNIPYGTTSDEIETLFARHGEVTQVLLPPAGTLAIVQMAVPGEAKVAFRSLAYRRFKDSVLYLEKAPSDLFVGGAGQGASLPKHVAKGKEPQPSKVDLKLGQSSSGEVSKDTEGAASAATGGDASSAPPGASLFVKNLNFTTTDAGLTAAFAGFPDFAFARVQTKPAPAPSASNSATSRGSGGGRPEMTAIRADGRLSMGYGFAVFKNANAASKAQKAMDGFLLDGYALKVQFAKRGHDGDDEAASGKAGSASSSSSSLSNSTKLMIKNLPFETTKKDVRELFGAHGQVRSVRLPKRIDNRPRGFAFVEFVSHREAEAAKEALKHTRLLGRHLVIGWAESEGSGAGVGGVGSSSDSVVERQRAKEAAAAAASDRTGGLGDAAGSKKAKLRLGEQDIADAFAAEKRRREDEDEDEE
ncbi:Multiple RNA-binding domain-containing protein 1 [Tilletia horrida]|uniref:Multiple RNA-binding domain-containing protein 1 n=1 Tax=Tilletia horrida TaxID=155126 RepID=A0AAN6GN75_9BASI|nr:Multiple RNA-binding domain-containing protein 1 [Tilletia horrida]KAK0554650.1 Multiple RNA-binding domain-containing protein 1 [Tilletia horrida]KAK0563258.1 Multiple RNA-binding domain-containing protein 1 [Tilletia horrida]